MGRLIVLLLVVLGFVAVANDGIPMPEGLEGKLWLIAILPGVYILGWGLLKD